MRARAYVLIEAEAGQVGAIIGALRGMPGVSTAEAVTGPYDVVVVIETYQTNGHLPYKLEQGSGIRGQGSGAIQRSDALCEQYTGSRFLLSAVGARSGFTRRQRKGYIWAKD
jgi:hypothetical protein